MLNINLHMQPWLEIIAVLQHLEHPEMQCILVDRLQTSSSPVPSGTYLPR
jgi:hypothetical protein